MKNKEKLVRHKIGLLDEYNKDKFKNIIYFTEDEKSIILNGIEYLSNNIYEIDDYSFKILFDSDDFLLKIDNRYSTNFVKKLKLKVNFGDSKIKEFDLLNSDIVEIKHTYLNKSDHVIKFYLESDLNDFTSNYNIPWMFDSKDIKDNILKCYINPHNNKYIRYLSHIGPQCDIILNYSNVSTIIHNFFSTTYEAKIINIPENLLIKNIPNGFASNCINIKNIIIPNQVEVIEPRAYSFCYNLNNITIPKSVMYISDTAFDNCPSLVDIKAPNHLRYEELNWLPQGLTESNVSWY